MKTISTFILFFVVPLLLTSCFDIIEVVTLNKKGAGTFLFEIDLTKSQHFINDPNNHHEYTDGEPITHKLVRLFKGDGNELDHINGISKVRSIANREKYLYGIEFEFGNIWALNQALNRLEKSLDSAIDMSRQKIYFKYKKNHFTRVATMDFAQDIKDHMSGEATDLSHFREVSFTTEYNLPTSVVKVSNPASEISADGKKVTHTYYPFHHNRDYMIDNHIEY